MRPPDKWTKKPAKGRKRKTDADPNGHSEPQSDFFGDYPSTLSNCAPETEDQTILSIRGGSPDLPEAPSPVKQRATSEQPSHKPSAMQSQWSNVDLDAALHRAIQSSPAGRSVLGGSQASPIDLAADDLTPQPTRRLLFPSPRSNREGHDHHKTLDNASIPGSKPQSTTIIETAFVEDPRLAGSDKENMAPTVDDDDDLAHLFECSPSIFRTPARKTSPTKKTPRMGSGASTFEDLLKTPTPNRSSLKTFSSNARQAFTPRTCTNNAVSSASTFLPTFSPSEKQNLCPTTPSRVANLSSPGRSGNRGEMTPFTRHLTQLLAAGSNEASPSRNFDFGDLSAFGMSPGNRGTMVDFDKMEFSIQDFEGIDFDNSNKNMTDGAVVADEQGSVTVVAAVADASTVEVTGGEAAVEQ